MQFHPSYHFARASPLPLDMVYLFSVGSNIHSSLSLFNLLFFPPLELIITNILYFVYYLKLLILLTS